MDVSSLAADIGTVTFKSALVMGVLFGQACIGKERVRIVIHECLHSHHSLSCWRGAAGRNARARTDELMRCKISVITMWRWPVPPE